MSKVAFVPAGRAAKRFRLAGKGKRWLMQLRTIPRTAKQLAAASPAWVGSPWAFVGSVVITIAWIVSGPLFHFSNGWLLVPATVTSTVTFLVVFLLQYSQNRDTRVVQLKLDELLSSLDAARTQLVRLESMSDEELDELEREFRKLRERVR